MKPPPSVDRPLQVGALVATSTDRQTSPRERSRLSRELSPFSGVSYMCVCVCILQMRILQILCVFRPSLSPSDVFRSEMRNSLPRNPCSDGGPPKSWGWFALVKSSPLLSASRTYASLRSIEVQRGWCGNCAIVLSGNSDDKRDSQRVFLT